MPAIFVPASIGLVRCSAERCQQFLHRRLAFAEDHEVRARLQIFQRVGSGLRTADDDPPARFARHSKDSTTFLRVIRLA